MQTSVKLWGVAALALMSAGPSLGQTAPTKAPAKAAPAGDAGLFQILPAGADVTAACAKAEGRACDQFEEALLIAVQTQQRCLEQLYKNPDYKAITDHFPLDEANPSAQQIADQSKPGGVQFAFIKTYDAAEMECRSAFISAAAKKFPALQPVLFRAGDAKMERWGSLFDGVTTWGNFNDANKRAVQPIEKLLVGAAQGPQAALFSGLPEGADRTAACAKAQGQPCDQSELAILTAAQTRRSCLEALYKNPDFQSITEHFPLDQATPSAAQLADASKPANANLDIINNYKAAQMGCEASLISPVYQKWPNLARILTRESIARSNQWNDFFGSGASWGKFNEANKHAVQPIEKLIAEAASAPTLAPNRAYESSVAAPPTAPETVATTNIRNLLMPAYDVQSAIKVSSGVGSANASRYCSQMEGRACSASEIAVVIAYQAREVCHENLHGNDRYKSITAHLPQDPRSVSLVQLADKALPDAKQISLISAYHDERQKCDAALAAAAGRKWPTIGSIYTLAFSREQDVWVDLVQRKINWGAFNTRLKDIVATNDVQLAQEEEVLARAAKQEAAQQAQAQAQQAAFAAQQRSQQQMLDSQRAMQAQQAQAAAQAADSAAQQAEQARIDKLISGMNEITKAANAAQQMPQRPAAVVPDPPSRVVCVPTAFNVFCSAR